MTPGGQAVLAARGSQRPCRSEGYSHWPILSPMTMGNGRRILYLTCDPCESSSCPRSAWAREIGHEQQGHENPYLHTVQTGVHNASLYKFNHGPLVPKLCFGTQFRQALLRVSLPPHPPNRRPQRLIVQPQPRPPRRRLRLPRRPIVNPPPPPQLPLVNQRNRISQRIHRMIIMIQRRFPPPRSNHPECIPHPPATPPRHGPFSFPLTLSLSAAFHLSLQSSLSLIVLHCHL